MRAAELALTLSNMHIEIDKVIRSTASNLYNTFQTDNKDNEQADKEATMHNMMVNYLVYSSINSKYKKYFDLGKVALDTSVEALGNDPSGIAGTTLNLHENNVFTFTKRQNKNSEQTTVVDLCNALARSGVEKAVVDAAMKQATKEKRGNVYYEVSTKID